MRRTLILPSPVPLQAGAEVAELEIDEYGNKFVKRDSKLYDFTGIPAKVENGHSYYTISKKAAKPPASSFSTISSRIAIPVSVQDFLANPLNAVEPFAADFTEASAAAVNANQAFEQPALMVGLSRAGKTTLLNSMLRMRRYEMTGLASETSEPQIRLHGPKSLSGDGVSSPPPEDSTMLKDRYARFQAVAEIDEGYSKELDIIRKCLLHDKATGWHRGPFVSIEDRNAASTLVPVHCCPSEESNRFEAILPIMEPAYFERVLEAVQAWADSFRSCDDDSDSDAEPDLDETARGSSTPLVEIGREIAV